jgi:hypothetical protein
MGDMKRVSTRLLGLLAACAVLAVPLFWAASASAVSVYTHPFIKSFDGSTSVTPEGPSENFVYPEHVAYDQVTHSFYVLDRVSNFLSGGKNVMLYRFDAAGNPRPFTALGPNVNEMPVGCPNPANYYDIAVDNSGGAHQSRFFITTDCTEQVRAFNPDGSEIGGSFPFHENNGCGVEVDPQGNIWSVNFYAGAEGYDSTGAPLGKHIAVEGSCTSATDTSQPPDPHSGYFYFAPGGSNDPNVEVYDAEANHVGTLVTDGSLILDNENHYLNTARDVAVDSSDHHAYVTDGGYGPHIAEFDTSRSQISTFGYESSAHNFGGLCDARGIAVDASTHDVYVADCNRIDVFGPGEYETFPTVTTDAPEVEPTSATLRAHVDPDGGGDITSCRFQYDKDRTYDLEVPCEQTVNNSDGNTLVTAHVENLEESVHYHYRVVAANENGPSFSADREFRAESKPAIDEVKSLLIKSDGGTVSARLDIRGAQTKWHFEWGTDSSYGHSAPLTDVKLPPDCNINEQPYYCPPEIDIRTVQTALTGLAPDTVYHWRLVASNEAGTTVTPDQFFKTYPTEGELIDKCPNALVRQQTGAARLMDCRAYELVSAANAGGYDVESSMVPGQNPLPAYPYAADRLLYSLHDGKIPDIAGNPPNLGLDPYVASRTAQGWVTRYVGLAADSSPQSQPFGSPLLGADSSLSIFAFGGAGLCSPCFPDGTTGTPVRLANGSLVQGMAGSSNPGAGATLDGYVGRALSADGRHLVFASSSQFDPAGNSNGDITVYDRDLQSGVTHVVSNNPAGGTMTGSGIGELDISSNGSTIVFGKPLSAPGAAPRRWHLYADVGDSAQSYDLTPGAAAGALYAGMTRDGSQVFFTSADKLLPSDTDNSADLYEAELGAGGAVTLRLISSGSGGAGNIDACDPEAGSGKTHWNTTGATADCGVLAFAGGAGVAAADGAVYFVSPEALDGHGVKDAPNLFVERPGGTPQLVATIDPDNPALLHAVTENEFHRYGDFQVTPNGDFAVFATTVPLTNYPTYGHSEIYRYATEGGIACVSCPPSNAAATSDATLTPRGLNLTDDGRVFLTTADQLTLRDTGANRDAYEWTPGGAQLISTGSSATGSALVTVSADGRDAFFATRQVLVPADENGNALKVYDARVEGGFPHDPERPPCQASDECHGPGTQAAPPPQIGSFEGTGGNSTQEGARRKRHHRHHHHHRRGRAKRHGSRHRHDG